VWALARTLVVVAAAFLLLSRPASAQWSTSAFLGDAATSPSRLDVRSDAGAEISLDNVHLDDESLQSPWYYGWRITRRMQRVSWLGFEVEFIHAKAIANTAQVVRIRGRLNGTVIDGHQAMSTVLPHFELSHGLNFLLGNAVVRWPIGSARHASGLAIVGRFGVGPTISHVESTFQAQSEDAYQFGGAAVGGGVGIEVRTTNHLFVVADVKVTTARQNLRVGSATIEGRFTTRHLSAGLMWRWRD
jgi:hypothetical protein